MLLLEKNICETIKPFNKPIIKFIRGNVYEVNPLRYDFLNLIFNKSYCNSKKLNS